MALVTVLAVPKSRRVIPPRSAQIENEIWIPARRISELRGETMSKVIRAAVIRYVARHRKLLDEDPVWQERGQHALETGEW